MASPKNIVISAQAFPPRSGGKQSLMQALAFYAAQSGAKVTVFADGKKGDKAFDSAQNTPYTVRRFGGLKFFRQRNKARAIARFCAHHKNTSIFCDSWRSAEPLPKDIKASVLVYAHGNEYPRQGEMDYKAKLSRIRNALSKADVLIPVSQNTKSRAAPFTPQSCRAALVLNPIAPAVTPTEADIDYARRLWPAEGKTRCLVLCRLVALKGVDKAIEAVAAHKDCQLVIAGDGEDMPRLRALAAQLGAQSRIVFTGRIEGGRKSALYASADIYLQPGRNVAGQYEGYGITYLEAGLHALPCISGNQGGAPEAVQDGVTGLVVDGTKLAEVSQALERLAGDRALRQALGQAGQQHALSQLWPQKIDYILGLPALKDCPSPLAHSGAHNYVEGQEGAAKTFNGKDEHHD